MWPRVHIWTSFHSTNIHDTDSSSISSPQMAHYMPYSTVLVAQRNPPVPNLHYTVSYNSSIMQLECQKGHPEHMSTHEHLTITAITPLEASLTHVRRLLGAKLKICMIGPEVIVHLLENTS